MLAMVGMCFLTIRSMDKDDIIRLVYALLTVGAFVCWLVFLATLVISAAFMCAALAFGIAQFFRRQLRTWAIACFLASLLTSFSPVDVTLHNAPRPPHFVPYVCGLPTKKGIELHQRGEIYFGSGCYTCGNEPLYVLVW